MRNEKVVLQRERDRLQTDLERDSNTDRTIHSSLALENNLEARLRQQMGWMSERILALEAQQRELEISVYSRGNAPPPGYSAVAQPS